MKTLQELSEMAEREYSLPNNSIEIDYLFNERYGFIKGYLACQEDMKQVSTNYAKFCIAREKYEMPLIDFDEYLKLT